MTETLTIGNSARPNSKGSWDWTFYIRPSDYIAEAIVTLHPTFPKPVHRLRAPLMEIKCTGWGTFPLDVVIHWKGGGSLQTKWQLVFDPSNEDTHAELQIPEEVVARNCCCMEVDACSDTKLEAPCRDDLICILAANPAMDPGSDPGGRAWHGRLIQEQLPPPRLTWQSQRKPREDKHGKQNVPDWLNASEYQEDGQSLAYKVRVLANILRCSKRTLAYTGAGLSVAAGIEMAAAGSSRARKSSPLEADPTLAHCIMAELNRHNILQGWMQQNHDGLPQKAGYRQEDINEIHGSWYDPSNPVVLYSGSLRGDLFRSMERWAETADVVLVLGTSLSGLNADQCVTKTASRSLDGSTASLGSVIISPQRTPEDGFATLRIFATADSVMEALAKELNLHSRLDPQHRRARFSSELRVKVPYDKNGKRSDTVQTWWNLTPGSKLRVSRHNNIEGAQQPAYLHIGPNMIGEALPMNERAACISIRFDASTTMQLGRWWIDAALRGGVKHLPVINVDAVEEPVNN